MEYEELINEIGNEKGVGVYKLWEKIIEDRKEEDVKDPHKFPRAAIILLQFQELPQKYLEGPQSDAKVAIRKHLQKYSRVTPQKRTSYEEVSTSIEKVCELAKQTLTWEEDIHSLPLFQAKWLTNIARLLPEDSAVLKILPYLITCYIMTATQNRLDPFDRPLSEASSGWRDIFFDLRKDKGVCATDNLSLSINSICQNFCLPIRGRNEAFFAGGEESENWMEKGRLRGRPSKSGNQNSRSKKTIEKNRILCWEYYRCFLALCKICDAEKIKGVSIALSMALFTSIWDWKDVNTYDPSLDRKLRQFTEDEIKTEMIAPQDFDGNAYDKISLRDYILGLDCKDAAKEIRPKDIVQCELFDKQIRKKIDDELNGPDGLGIFFNP